LTQKINIVKAHIENINYQINIDENELADTELDTPQSQSPM
jgi:hypothetical protein